MKMKGKIVVKYIYVYVIYIFIFVFFSSPHNIKRTLLSKTEKRGIFILLKNINVDNEEENTKGKKNYCL